MNTSNHSKFRSILALVAALTVGGCANGFILSMSTTRNLGIEPRVAILNKCPKAGDGTRKEKGLPKAVAGALIPALVDTGFNAINTALQNAVKDDTASVSTRTTSQFYGISTNQDEISRRFEVHKNIENRCLVVVHGPMSKNAPSAKFKGVYFSSIQRNALTERIGLQGNPYFYYEGRFVYSPDGSAFRIESAVIKYDRTIEDGGAGVRGLALNFSFALPSASADGKVFASATIPLGNRRTGTTLEGSLLGTTNATTYSTPWMPLPSVNENVKSALSEARLAYKNLTSTMANLKKTYVTQIDPMAKKKSKTISEWDTEKLVNLIDQDKVDAKLAEIRRMSKSLSEEIAAETIRLDDTVVTLMDKLDKEHKGLDGIEETERSINTRISLLKALSTLARKKENLKILIDNEAEVTTLKTAKRDLKYINATINKITKQLNQFTPFTVTATIVEKRDSNAVLKFFADVFAAAKPNLVSAIKTEIDPKTKKELEEKEKAAETARQDEFNNLRKVAALAVLKVKGAEIELRLLKPDANEIERHNAVVKFQTAVFEAADACQKAKRKLAHPPECAPYFENTEQPQ